VNELDIYEIKALQMLAGPDARQVGHVQRTTRELQVLQCAQPGQRLKAACNQVHLSGAQRSKHSESSNAADQLLQAQACFTATHIVQL
jgi:hypothetical protein